MYSITNVSETIYKSVVDESDVYNHKSIIVVGDNDSGKTTLLKCLLNRIKIDNNNDFYFIDALNRMVFGPDYRNQASEIRYSDFTPLEILRERSSEVNMSKVDIFPNSNQGYLVTYSELLGNTKKYESIFNAFFECKIAMSSTTGTDSIINGYDVLTINGKKIRSLSSSRAAILRLIMETEYAKSCGCKMVIIDEFDNSLDPDNQVKLILQLQDYYPKMRFVFVIHDFTLLVQLSGFDAVMYNNPSTAQIEANIIDCDDITAIGEVERIRAKYVGVRDDMEMFLANCISNHLKKGEISSDDNHKLLKINKNQLSLKNQILYEYLVELNNEVKHQN